jgi:hypothetical protein
MNTGEGKAIAAGSEDLAGVDLDQVLDGRFLVAVQAVAEVNASGGEGDRFEQVRQAYRQKLAAATGNPGAKGGQS